MNLATQCDASENDEPAGAPHAKTWCAAGFSAALAWICLYWGNLVLSDVGIYNHALFAAIAHAVTLLALMAAEAFGSSAEQGESSFALRKPFGLAENVLVACAYFVSSALLVAYFLIGTPLFAALSSVAFGIASAYAGVFWVRRIAGERVRFSFKCAVCAMIASMLVALACLCLGEALVALLCVALPIASGALAFAPAPEAPSQNAIAGADAPRRQLPWPFLSALFACCMVSALFVGLATNPYIFQSQTIVRWWLVIATVALIVLLVWSICARRSDVRAFFLASLAFLLVGLFLFSTGVLGSIILPLSMVMAAETCCVALCWATACLLVRRVGDRALPIACIGLLLGDGVAARGVGMIVNNNFTLSFPVVATAASALIAFFALFYACATSAGARGDSVVPVGLDESDDRAGAFLDSFGFTLQEQRVASCILEGLKYREIAERLELSERTVKFHAKNSFAKVGVSNRADFERRGRDWK